VNGSEAKKIVFTSKMTCPITFLANNVSLEVSFNEKLANHLVVNFKLNVSKIVVDLQFLVIDLFKSKVFISSFTLRGRP
jgi:hypothetical protein